MSNDDHIRRRPSSRRKSPYKDYYAALEHRVIDSPAFADLQHSSIRLLLIIARQLTQDNNGHLQATWSYCRKRGIGSENTLSAAIKDLISHGFIFNTRSRGANKQWAKFAVTWLPIKRKDGLYLQNFEIDPWRRWEKKLPSKSAVSDHQKVKLGELKAAEADGYLPSKTEDYELVPSTQSKDGFQGGLAQ